MSGTPYDPEYYIEPDNPPWATTTMTHPPDDPEVEDLRVAILRDAETGVTFTASAWKLSDHQREMIAAGATIRMTVFAHPTPPVALGIEPPWCHGCVSHMWFHYEGRKFVCNCPEEESHAEDDPDASRSAVPEELRESFVAAPEDDGEDPGHGA